MAPRPTCMSANSLSPKPWTNAAASRAYRGRHPGTGRTPTSLPRAAFRRNRDGVLHLHAPAMDGWAPRLELDGYSPGLLVVADAAGTLAVGLQTGSRWEGGDGDWVLAGSEIACSTDERPYAPLCPLELRELAEDAAAGDPSPAMATLWTALGLDGR